MSPDAAGTRVALPDVLSSKPQRGGACGVDRSGALTEIHINAPGRYIVELSPTDRRMPFLRLNVCRRGHPDRVVYVPVGKRTSYLLKSSECGVSLQFDSSDMVASGIRRIGIGDLGLVLRRRRRQKQFELPLGQGIVLRPLLHLAGAEEQHLTAALASLTGWGFGVASDNLQKTLSRLFDGPPAQARERLLAAEPKIAVAMHLHYSDLWPEFETLLEAIDRPFHLILTLTGPDATLTERVQARFPAAEVMVYDNRGRDIGPFVQLLREGRLDRFDLICKLHGKKSGSNGPRMVLGEIWRRASAFDLIGSRDVVDRIVAAFERSPETGMIGSRRFLLPNEWKAEAAGWGKNREAILTLLETLGMAADSPLHFFAGTMFWVRRRALEPLKRLDLSLASFPGETGQLDGTLQHALERILGMICTKVSGTTWDDEKEA